jgi:hypothetical protein
MLPFNSGILSKKGCLFMRPAALHKSILSSTLTENFTLFTTK